MLQKVDKELAVALAALDKERTDAIQGLDSQVSALKKGEGAAGGAL